MQHNEQIFRLPPAALRAYAEVVRWAQTAHGGGGAEYVGTGVSLRCPGGSARYATHGVSNAPPRAPLMTSQDLAPMPSTAALRAAPGHSLVRPVPRPAARSRSAEQRPAPGMFLTVGPRDRPASARLSSATVAAISEPLWGAFV